MFRLTERQINRVILNRGECFFAGLALMALPFVLPHGWRFGMFSGFMLLSLSLYGFALRKWRTEPGLWMLAVLLTITIGPCWAYFEFLHWWGLLAGLARKQAAHAITWDQLRFSIDAVIALTLFAGIVKLAVGVSIENWKRTRDFHG